MEPPKLQPPPGLGRCCSPRHSAPLQGPRPPQQPQLGCARPVTLPSRTARLPRRASRQRTATMTMAIAVPTATAIDELSVGRGELVRDEAPSPASRRSQGTTRSGRSVASIPVGSRRSSPPPRPSAPIWGSGPRLFEAVASTSDPTPGPYQPVTTLIHRGGSVSCRGSGGFCSGTARPARAAAPARDAGAGLLRVAEAGRRPKVARETGNFVKPTKERERSAYSFGRTSACPARACT